jgi:hypothetical protein
MSLHCAACACAAKIDDQSCANSTLANRLDAEPRTTHFQTFAASTPLGPVSDGIIKAIQGDSSLILEV